MTNTGEINARIAHCEAKVDEALENEDWLDYSYWTEELDYALLCELHLEDI